MRPAPLPGTVIGDPRGGQAAPGTGDGLPDFKSRSVHGPLWLPATKQNQEGPLAGSVGVGAL